jgi:hypothetical protein
MTVISAISQPSLSHARDRPRARPDSRFLIAPSTQTYKACDPRDSRSQTDQPTVLTERHHEVQRHRRSLGRLLRRSRAGSQRRARAAAIPRAPAPNRRHPGHIGHAATEKQSRHPEGRPDMQLFLPALNRRVLQEQQRGRPVPSRFKRRLTRCSANA